MIRGIWDNFPGKINIKQKIFLAIFVPILLFAITYTIAYYVSVEVQTTQGYYSFSPNKKTSPDMGHAMAVAIKIMEADAGNPNWQPGDPAHSYYPAVTHKYYDPYDWQRTWYVWILFLIFCGVFEYKLFEDKK